MGAASRLGPPPAPGHTAKWRWRRWSPAACTRRRWRRSWTPWRGWWRACRAHPLPWSACCRWARRWAGGCSARPRSPPGTRTGSRRSPGTPGAPAPPSPSSPAWPWCPTADTGRQSAARCPCAHGSSRSRRRRRGAGRRPWQPWMKLLPSEWFRVFLALFLWWFVLDWTEQWTEWVSRRTL